MKLVKYNIAEGQEVVGEEEKITIIHNHNLSDENSSDDILRISMTTSDSPKTQSVSDAAQAISFNTEVATVAVTGNEVKITAVQAGETAIKVFDKTGNVLKDIELTVTTAG